MLRRMRLAGNKRAGRWARNRAWSTQVDYLRRVWLQLLGFLALGIALLSAASLLIPNLYMRGLALGVGATSLVAMILTWVIQVTGTAPIMMGEQGEQWTASELRKLRRSGWRLVNHVLLKTGDIDHVLVGPGGIFAVETKWSSWDWAPTADDKRLIGSAKQVAASANSLTLWTELRRTGVGRVQPIVFVWGPGSSGIDSVIDVAGTQVIPGQAATRWRRGLPTGVLDAKQVESAWQVLDKQVRMRDPREAEQQPAPRSLAYWGYSMIGALVVAGLGALAVAETARWTSSDLWTVVAALALLGLGLLGMRVPRIRLFALAWSAGVAGTAVVGAAAALLFAWHMI